MLPNSCGPNKPRYTFLKNASVALFWRDSVADVRTQLHKNLNRIFEQDQNHFFQYNHR